MIKLTEKQNEIYKFIKKFIKDNGYSPSCRNVSDYFEITVKGAFDHIRAIENK